jgi:hypothetical protein
MMMKTADPGIVREVLRGFQPRVLNFSPFRLGELRVGGGESRRFSRRRIYHREEASHDRCMESNKRSAFHSPSLSAR